MLDGGLFGVPEEDWDGLVLVSWDGSLNDGLARRCRSNCEFLSPLNRAPVCYEIHGVSISQSVEGVTLGEEVLGSIPVVAARSLLVGSCPYSMTGWDRSYGLPALASVWQHVKLSDVSLGTRPRYSLADDEDFKNPNKQNLKKTSMSVCLSVCLPACLCLSLSLLALFMRFLFIAELTLLI